MVSAATDARVACVALTNPCVKRCLRLSLPILARLDLIPFLSGAFCGLLRGFLLSLHGCVCLRTYRPAYGLHWPRWRKLGFAGAAGLGLHGQSHSDALNRTPSFAAYALMYSIRLDSLLPLIVAVDSRR